jgi:hypothetical protein
VTFAEDSHQARTGNGPAVAAVLRNTAIGYHRSNSEPNIARATRRANRRPPQLDQRRYQHNENAMTLTPSSRR